MCRLEESGRGSSWVRRGGPGVIGRIARMAEMGVMSEEPRDRRMGIHAFLW